jgi:hypothetical protein
MEDLDIARLLLPESEFLKVVADTVPAIAVHVSSGYIVHANAEAEQNLFECDALGGLIGEPFERFIPSELRPKHQNHTREYEKDPRNRKMGDSRTKVEILTYDGKRRKRVEATLRPLKKKKNHLYVILTFVIPAPEEGVS